MSYNDIRHRKILFHDYFDVFLNDDIISNILYFEKTFLIFPFNLSYSWQSNNHLILKEQICIAKIFWKICKIIKECLQIIMRIWKLIIILTWHSAYHISNVPLINEINEKLHIKSRISHDLYLTSIKFFAT